MTDTPEMVERVIEANRRVWDEWPESIDAENVEQVREAAAWAAVQAIGLTQQPYDIVEPSGGWRGIDTFTDAEKRKLRPIAETLAMLDGNAFFTMCDGMDQAWFEQYLPEAHALYEANGGDKGWAGMASFASAALGDEVTS